MKTAEEVDLCTTCITPSHRVNWPHLAQYQRFHADWIGTMDPMSDPDRTLRGEQLGEELRRLREQAKLNLNDAAGRIGGSASKLSRIETAIIGVQVEDVAGLLAVYGVVGKQRRTPVGPRSAG